MFSISLRNFHSQSDVVFKSLFMIIIIYGCLVETKEGLAMFLGMQLILLCDNKNEFTYSTVSNDIEFLKTLIVNFPESLLIYKKNLPGARLLLCNILSKY